MRSSFCRPVASTSLLLLHQQQRIGGKWCALPGRGVAFGKPPCAVAACDHKLLAVKPPGRWPEGCDAPVTTGLYHDLVGILCAAASVRKREPAQRLVELAHDLPFAENLVGTADLGLERSLGLHEIETLALALGLENTALDLGKLEHRSFAAVDEPQLILGSQRPGHDLLERHNGAGRVELELEAATARRRIDTECHRTA